MNIANALNDMNSKKEVNLAPFATVEEVSDKGVKIRLDGEESAREIYYDSLAYVNVGDRVRLDHVSGTIIIQGKLLYYRKEVSNETKKV